MNETRMPRVAQVTRETSESQVKVRVNLDGTGQANIHTTVRP